MSRTAVNISGQKFGRLTVIERAKNIAGYSNAHWICECDCGKTVPVSGHHLRMGATKSCGCLPRGNTKHGKYLTPEYIAWKNMIYRCCNPQSDNYPAWGGRGITVCERWLNDFESFFADMGKRPSPKHSLDREDNNLGYSPDNCRWATKKEQNNNRRCNAKYKNKTLV